MTTTCLGLRGLVVGVLVGGAVGLTGCGHDTTVVAPEAAALPWTLTLNVHAATLVNAPPYDTVRLVPTVLAGNGTVLPGPVKVTYTTSDLGSAVVDSTGLVTARGAVNQVLVIASASVADVTVSDTAVLRIDDSAVVGTHPAPPTHLTLEGTQNPLSPVVQPVPDPALGLTGLTVDCEAPFDNLYPFTILNLLSVALTPQLTAADGTTGTDVLVEYHSSNPALLVASDQPGHTWVGPMSSFFVQSYCYQSGQLGPVTITATTRVYGAVLKDSVRIHVIPSLFGRVTVLQRVPRATGQPVNYFEPGTITIGAGGIILWDLERQNVPQAPDTTIDVVFDNPPAVPQGVDTLANGIRFRQEFPFPFDSAGGNIAPFAADTTQAVNSGIVGRVGFRARKFSVPGTYHYHSAHYGTSGTIVVLPWTP